MDQLEKLLSEKELQLQKDQEIERILSCNSYDYVSIIGLDPLTELAEVEQVAKKKFRKKTLLIHPDKSTNPMAPLAFDRLKKSEQVLCLTDSNHPDESEDIRSLLQEKQRLLEIYKSLISQMKLEDVEVDLTEQQKNELKDMVSSALDKCIREEQIEISFQQNQESKKQNDEKKLRLERELRTKLKNEWEDDRDLRVKNWRTYVKKVEKKKSKKGMKKKLLA